MVDKPHIVILGAGPAGLGAAYKLTQRGLAKVTVIERNSQVAGNAGSFELAGMRVDYGSHRLHPACDPEVLHDIRNLLGADLLDRPRHGRIRLRGRWIHFPLKPLDLAMRLPLTFALGVGVDAATKVLRRQPASPGNESFASVLEAGLGRTICRDFYFPYARKIWGVEPEQLSTNQARRRVGSGSLGKMARKVISAVPGLKPKGSGRFFYPRNGYGQISEAFNQAAQEAGADIVLKARVDAVETNNSLVQNVVYERNGEKISLRADQVWSTIPLTILARLLNPAPPAELLAAISGLHFRAMVLIYLVVEQDHFSDYDAHYFPELQIPISRLSEPKNYSAGHGPSGLTVLCAELPCVPDGPEWGQSDEELAETVCQSLDQAGIPIQGAVKQVAVRRLRQAYPIYQQGYETYFDKLDSWLASIDGLLTFGRQGLFAHDNTHHALYMAYCATACLDRAGRFDTLRWREFRRTFEAHVVED